MGRWSPVVSLAVTALGALAFQACKSGCDGELVDRAMVFMQSHQSCAVDDDCVVVGDFCETLPGGYCGQLTMNRTGAESAEWRSITDELGSCAPGSCEVCLAALVPACSDGVCGGP
jgi:hypothetical protein